MFCQNCGSENADSARFCTACGAAVSSPATRIEHAAGEHYPLELYEAVVGPRNRDYYLRRFERFEQGGSRLSWHWPAFLVTFFWLLYRKMWLAAVLFFFLPSILFIPFTMMAEAIAPGSEGAASFAYLAWFGVYFFLPAMFANSLYFSHCRSKIDQVAAATTSRERQLGELSAKGGTSNVALIVFGLMAFVMMLGIVAAIAIPAYQAYTIKAKLAQAQGIGKIAAESVAGYYYQNNKIPANLGVTSFSAPLPPSVTGVSVSPDDGTVSVKVQVGHPEVDGRSVLLVPTLDKDKKIEWTCLSRDIPEQHLPPACQGGDEAN